MIHPQEILDLIADISAEPDPDSRRLKSMELKKKRRMFIRDRLKCISSMEHGLRRVDCHGQER